ncbi:MAG: sigma-54 dependent transcriptional regulator [Thermodesulfobacteriota bacterium]
MSQKDSVLFIARSNPVSELFPTLKEMGYKVKISENLDSALQELKKYDVEMIFSEPKLSGYNVEDLFREGANLGDGLPPVIVVTEQGTADEAKRLMEAGAKDYWLMPVTREKIRLVLQPREQKSPRQKRTEKASPASEIIGEHKRMQKAISLAGQVAASRATILITGASGTGKEMFARYIHKASDRSDKPFIAINCAALPEHLLESELFGHEKGAFTGAVQRKPGKFELAHAGTLLLDEITEMDMSLQAKLLRVLQDGKIDRLGGTETLQVDVRVLATTNRDLEECVANGTFREDLFYRLNVIPIHLPSLKEREQDILLLAEHFIRKFCKEYNLPLMELTQEARQWMLNHEWPGNVRELQNLMERAVLLAGGKRIKPSHFLLQEEDLDEEVQQDQEQAEQSTEAEGGPVEDQVDNQGLIPLYEMEKRMIYKGLAHTEGNRSQAAKLLGISVRTLRNKLNEYRQDGS